MYLNFLNHTCSIFMNIKFIFQNFTLTIFLKDVYQHLVALNKVKVLNVDLLVLKIYFN